MSTSLFSSYAAYPNFTPYIGNALVSAANANGVSPSFLLTQAAQESGFNSNATNGSAAGLGQFMPGTAAQYGLSDPYSGGLSANAMAQYDAALLNRNGGNYTDVANQYGTGAGNFNALATSLGVPTTSELSSTSPVVPMGEASRFAVPGQSVPATYGGSGSTVLPGASQGTASPFSSISSALSGIAKPFEYVSKNPGSALVLVGGAVAVVAIIIAAVKKSA